MNSRPVWAIVVRPTVTVARTSHDASVKQFAGIPPNPAGDTNPDNPANPKEFAWVTLRCGPEPLVENGIMLSEAVTLGPPTSWTVAVTLSRRPRAWASIPRAAAES